MKGLKKEIADKWRCINARIIPEHRLRRWPNFIPTLDHRGCTRSLTFLSLYTGDVEILTEIHHSSLERATRSSQIPAYLWLTRYSSLIYSSSCRTKTRHCAIKYTVDATVHSMEVQTGILTNNSKYTPHITPLRITTGIFWINITNWSVEKYT